MTGEFGCFDADPLHFNSLPLFYNDTGSNAQNVPRALWDGITMGMSPVDTVEVSWFAASRQGRMAAGVSTPAQPKTVCFLIGFRCGASLSMTPPGLLQKTRAPVSRQKALVF